MKLGDKFLKSKNENDAKIKRLGKTFCLFSECISIKVFFSKEFEAEKSLKCQAQTH